MNIHIISITTTKISKYRPFTINLGVDSKMRPTNLSTSIEISDLQFSCFYLINPKSIMITGYSSFLSIISPICRTLTQGNPADSDAWVSLNLSDRV